MKKRNHYGLTNQNFSQNSYVTLRSDKSIYNENTNSNFISTLIFPIKSNEYSKVALTDFIYTNDISINLGILTINYKPYIENLDLYILPENNKKIQIEIENTWKKLNQINLSYPLEMYKRFYNPATEDDWTMLQRLREHEDDIVKNLNFICNSISKISNLLANTDFNYKVLIFSDEIDSDSSIYTKLITIIDQLNNLKKRKIFEIIFNEKMALFTELFQQMYGAMGKYADRFEKQISINIKNNCDYKEIEEFFINLNLSNCTISSNKNKIKLAFIQNIIFKADAAVFENFKVLITTNSVEFQTPHKLNVIKNFFVYTNIINDDLKFQNNEQLLQIIKADGDDLELVHKNFENPHYLSLNKTYINSIEIQIKDSKDQFVKFSSPPVLKLHFQKIEK